MHRRLLIPLLFLLIACRALFPASQASPTDLPELPSPQVTPTPFTPSISPTPSTEATTIPPPGGAQVPASDTFTVRLHPDDALYVGDQVSLEVIPPQEIDLEGRRLQVRLESPPQAEPLETTFSSYGIGDRRQATLLWAWDTSSLAPGEYSLNFSIHPGGPTWTETVSLHPANQAPPPEPQAAWASAESDCCLVYYITGTAVQRDIDQLLEMLDDQAQSVSQLLQFDLGSLEEPIEVMFAPRVLGHGGFAGQEVSVSYLDRNYAGKGAPTILHHELVHVLDGRLGGELRPTILIEGLAVYLTGGHFKPEPLMPRAAALLPPEPGCAQATPASTGQVCGLGWYIPMDVLVDNFYFEQHEIGYLEAGALVEFMVETWGWQAFSEFYRNIHHPPEPPPEAQEAKGPHFRAMNAALVEHFGVTLEQLEMRFLEALREEDYSPEMVEDVRLVAGYYNAVRRYQQILDPSAYFLNAWLLDVQQMRQRGIVADYLRRPSMPENQALETMLVSVDGDIRAGDYLGAAQVLAAVDAVLDAYDNHAELPFSVDLLAADYLALVRVVRAAGYQPHRIDVDNGKARAWVSITGPEIVEVHLFYSRDGWVFDQEAGFGLKSVPIIRTGRVNLQTGCRKAPRSID
ncbi:MAG: hypothetical protein JXA78_01150 [Anaerolineales bacterium]|nr:hypothetical protein [Anaerolineales bacterium]